MALKDLTGDNFFLGAATTGWHLELDERIGQTLACEFNLLTPENEFKLRSVMPKKGKFDCERADKLVDFARKHSLALRGTNLMWRLGIPSWVSSLSQKDTRSTLETYIAEVVTRYENDVSVWDVACEMLNANGGLVKTHWSQSLGPHFIVDAFRFARNANPAASLFYSDYGWHNESKQKAFLELVQTLRSAGVGIDGLAIQMHHNIQGTLRLLRIEDFLTQVRDLGLEIHFSEVTLWASDKVPWGLMSEVQAVAYGKLLSLALKCGAKVFCIWGVSDKYAWRKRNGKPFLFDDDFKPKPAYFAVEKVLQEWRESTGEMFSVG